MRARAALAVAVSLVVLSATTWSLLLADRGPAFSTTATVEGGYALLVIPTVLCLLASIGLALRSPGRKVAAVGFAWAALAWVAGEWDNPVAGSDVAFSVGLLVYAASPVAVLYAGLSRSGGAVPRRIRAGLLVVGCLLMLGLQGLVVATVFDPAAGGCRGCASNLWLVSGDQAALSTLDRVGVRAGLAWLAAVVIVLCVALLRSSPALRRTAGPTLAATLAFEGVTLASYAHSWLRGFLGSDDVDKRLWTAQATALGLLGITALAELVRERRAHRALSRIVVDLSDVAVSTRTLRDALAVRLADRDLVLAYPVDGGKYVDAAARPVTIEAAPGREATRLERAGRPLATLVHRANALPGRDAADELVAAIHLGLEHEQLRAQALAQVEDLRASGLRLIETGDAERRRIERDLHDGAQQRLVGLALGLRLMEAQTGGSPAVAEAAEELTAAIDDLRTLARGLSPVLLADAGLGAALRGLGESRELRLLSVPGERLPPVVESTAYAVVERLSAERAVDVDIRRDDSGLCLLLVARGGAVPGLEDLAGLGDRVTSLGGEVVVEGPALRVLLPVGDSRSASNAP
jgi:signal transduction histidine kinase